MWLKRKGTIFNKPHWAAAGMEASAPAAVMSCSAHWAARLDELNASSSYFICWKLGMTVEIFLGWPLTAGGRAEIQLPTVIKCSESNDLQNLWRHSRGRKGEEERREWGECPVPLRPDLRFTLLNLNFKKGGERKEGRTTGKKELTMKRQKTDRWKKEKEKEKRKKEKCLFI